VGDAVADDSACLQAALDAAFAPNGPGFLLVPPGTYKVSSILRVASLERQRGDLTPGVRQPLVMIGCHGSGDAAAKGAGLARIGSEGAGVRFGLEESQPASIERISHVGRPTGPAPSQEGNADVGWGRRASRRLSSRRPADPRSRSSRRVCGEATSTIAAARIPPTPTSTTLPTFMTDPSRTNSLKPPATAPAASAAIAGTNNAS
jgi:hypothetical protein